MNNTEKMQMMADVFNEAGEEPLPDYEWILVRDPYETQLTPTINIELDPGLYAPLHAYHTPEIIPDIHLVRKDGSSEGVDENTCIRMRKIFNRIGFNFHESKVESFKNLRTNEITKNGIVTIKAMGNLAATAEDIEKIGDDYAKYVKEIFNPEMRQSAKGLADELNRIGKLQNLGFKFVVNEGIESNHRYIDIVESPSIMNPFPNKKVMLEMINALTEAIKIASNDAEVKKKILHTGYTNSQFTVYEVLTGEEIGQISLAYYKGIRDLGVPLSTKIMLNLHKLMGKEHC